jgi:GDP-4-dehydro-6-deoxy-D-mannose reductase
MPPLVTGATGFVGSRALQAWPQAVAWPGVDLRDRAAVQAAVRSLMLHSPFDGVLHLAGISSIQNSFDDPLRMFEVNLMGTLHLLEALSAAQWRGRFLFVSSGAVYGDPERLVPPTREDTPLAPNSPYAASKAAAEHAVLEWGRRSGAAVMVARPTNHAGPGQTEHYFLPSMACQISRVPRGERVIVETGNLDAYRDFLHVDDVIEAYRAILDKGRAGTVYNVASGRSQPLCELLRRLIQASGRQVETRVRSERFRQEPRKPLEVSIERLQGDTGWSPGRGIDQLLADLIRYWEDQP